MTQHSESLAPSSKRRLAFGALVGAIMTLAGCFHGGPKTEVSSLEMEVPEGAIVVPGNRGWVNTGVQVVAGQPITISAGGKVVVGKTRRRGSDEVDPAGTYFFSDSVVDEPFPLPSAAQGPAPCYALIGRIDNGEPFVIGRQKSWTASQTGTLWLGVNDFDVSDNVGQFYAEISHPKKIQPVSHEEIATAGSSPGSPVPGCSVVVIYVDGLRPDVVREMAALGHIPNMNRLFVEQGAWLSNAFTAFPSDTITSNGTMWTGCFSDRHGLKGQVRFSRTKLESESYLDPLGPSRSARLLQPQGLDYAVNRTQEESRRILFGADESRQWKAANTTGIPPIYAHLRNHGGDWSTGILPIMTDIPPLLWTRSMAREMPYFHSQKAWQYIDNANTHYAVKELLQRRDPVTIIWLPETDSVSHKQCRGQFGMTRRTIAKADLCIGEIVSELRAQRRLDKTYLFLVSDHGHHGGRTTHLSHFDIANELIYKPREMTRDGRWVGGGLGLSVRQHRSWNRHRGDGRRNFVFVDGDSDGVARLFLPKNNYHSGDWTGPNAPAKLFSYPISKSMMPLNVVESICATKAVHGNGQVTNPIDLVLLKLTDHSIMIATLDRGYAVIDRKKDENQKWVYRYQPVQNIRPMQNGVVMYDVVQSPKVDPLRLLETIQPELLKYYHSERAWLAGTAQAPYPDSVVTLTRHLLWQENLTARENEFAPDLVVTARPGWYFGTKSSPGTMHGYPLADAMRASWFVTGPGIRRGARVERPCRLVDLTPTILDIVGLDVEELNLDGEPVRSIYEPEITVTRATTQPVYWQDVDLAAWNRIGYTPLDESRHKPFTINRPDSAFDLNNIAYNALTIGELSLFRMFDDVVSPLAGDDEHLTTTVERVEQQGRHVEQGWVAEGVQAINVSGVTLGDYSPTSLGNMKRVDGAVDWVQNRVLAADHQIARPLGREHLPGATVFHGAIDGTQNGFWEAYRFAQRVLIEVLDESILSGLEDRTDGLVNGLRRQPAETLVDDNALQTPARTARRR